LKVICPHYRLQGGKDPRRATDSQRPLPTQSQRCASAASTPAPSASAAASDPVLAAHFLNFKFTDSPTVHQCVQDYQRVCEVC
jgi:hypothetical protein